MQRIAGDTETRGNVFFTEQWIGRNPASQLRGKLARLLHRGFRHENHKFVAAVASYHIRPAAIRFENLSDALQNKVSFEVAIKIVDKLEAIEVHENKGKSTAGASRALPLGRQGFHEETVR